MAYNRAAETMAGWSEMARCILCCPNFYFYFFSTASVSILWRTCVYTHISDCVQIVYELPLLSYKTASETLLHKSGAVRSVDWRFIIGAPAWWWLGEYVTLEKSFTIFFSNSPQLLQHFLPYRIPLRALIRNIIIILCFSYTIWL
jgi:hypothetical protein